MGQVNWPLVCSFAAAAVIELAAPVLLAVWLARRYRPRWRYWLYGVLVFLVFQGFTRIPAVLLLQTRPFFQEALKQPVWLWLYLGFLALTAGLFEEGGRWLAFRYVVRPDDRNWRTAMMLGAGHGGLESIGVGLLVAATLVGYLVIMLVPADAFHGYQAQIAEARRHFGHLHGWEPLLGCWERLGALAIQLALTVMVLQAFTRGRRWWWYALGAHTAVDSPPSACCGSSPGSWVSPPRCWPSRAW